MEIFFKEFLFDKALLKRYKPAFSADCLFRRSKNISENFSGNAVDYVKIRLIV